MEVRKVYPGTLIEYAEINEQIFVKLRDGTKLYGCRELELDKDRIPPYLNFAEWRLGISDENFLSFICVLLEINYFEIYEQIYRPKTGDVVVDAGAFVGMFTVKASKAVGPEGTVVAIEPDQDNLKYLKKNVEENKLENVIIIDKGLWNEKGKMKLYHDYRSAGSLVYSRERFSEIRVNTLDNLLEELQLIPDYIKMDVEGAEEQVLEGAKNILSQEKSLKMVIGAYHEINGKKTYESIIPKLERLRFEIERTGGIIHAKRVI